MKVENEYAYYWTIEPEWVEYSAQGAIHHDSPLHLGPQGVSHYQMDMKIIPDPKEDFLYMIQQGDLYEVIRIKQVFHNNVCRVERGVLGTIVSAFPAFALVYPIRINRTVATSKRVISDAQEA